MRAALVLVAACGGSTPDTCPSWGETYEEADGRFSVSGPGIDNDDWMIAVEGNAGVPGFHTVSIRACKAEYDENMNPWESWTFVGVWRLQGPVASPMMIPGATLSGVPGMSGGVSSRSAPDTLTSSHLFMQNGAAELTVDTWDPLGPHFKSQGWVLTDGATAVQIDLSVDLNW